MHEIYQRNTQCRRVSPFTAFNTQTFNIICDTRSSTNQLYILSIEHRYLTEVPRFTFLPLCRLFARQLANGDQAAAQSDTAGLSAS